MIIYKLTNTLNDKVYIGQTKNLKRRIKEYKSKSIKPSNRYHIMEVIQKVGFDNFEISVIEEVDKSISDDREEYWIKFYKSLDHRYGYNRRHGGKDGKHNKLSKNKMSRSSKNFKHSEETKLKKSKPIILFKNNIFYHCNSAKLFGDFIGSERSVITRSIKNGTKVKGFLIFYQDTSRLEELMKTNDKKSYLKIINKIIKGVETIPLGSTD